MSNPHGVPRDRRVLILVPTGRDASMVQVVLSQAHIAHEIYPAFATLLQELGLGAAAVLVPEEVITPTNITLLCEVLASQPLSGDAVRLTQVFTNLLNNAAKYTDAGGHIRVTASREADRALVSVRDDGIGIPPAQLASVFEMFSQLDRWHRRTQGGLGLGLTLVRTLVTMHGGQVEARSQGLGSGSEFVVDLPLLVGASAEAERTGPPRKFPARRILVVDDNLDAGEMLRALLTALGATAAKAHSGRVALEVLDSFKPDTVLLDIGMPDMDGYEVARRIRAMPAHRGMLLVAVTGWGQEHDQRRSLEAGFDHHFVKPLDVDKLGDFLRTGQG